MTALLLAGLLTGVQPLTLPEPPPRQPWSETRKAETLYLACGAADLASTAVALHNGFEEANPLAKSDRDGETLAKLGALKLGLYGLFKVTKAPPWVYRYAGYVQCGAAAWNTGQVLSR